MTFRDFCVTSILLLVALVVTNIDLTGPHGRQLLSAADAAFEPTTTFSIKAVNSNEYRTPRSPTGHSITLLDGGTKSITLFVPPTIVGESLMINMTSLDPRKFALASVTYSTLQGLTDTDISSPLSGQLLSWNGTKWINKSVNSGLTPVAVSGDQVLANSTLYVATAGKYILPYRNTSTSRLSVFANSTGVWVVPNSRSGYVIWNNWSSSGVVQTTVKKAFSSYTGHFVLVPKGSQLDLVHFGSPVWRAIMDVAAIDTGIQAYPEVRTGDTGYPGSNVAGFEFPNISSYSVLYTKTITITAGQSGLVTRAHWDTYSAGAGNAVGIWDSSGIFLGGTAVQSGNNTSPTSWDADLTSSVNLNEGSTYYIGVWCAMDSAAGSYITDDTNGSVGRWIQMDSFGLNFNPASLTADGASTRKLQLRFDNAQ